MRVAWFAATAVLFAAASANAAATLTVNGTDDIFAAGLATAPASTGGGGTLPSFVAVKAGQTLRIAATGSVYCCVPSSLSVGPDGFASNPFGSGSHITNSTGSTIGSYTNAVGSFALAGAFTGGSASTAVFKIGSAATVLVPTGATKLYFGLPDGYGFNGPSAAYADNSGSFSVAVAVPEPASWVLMIAGFGLIGGVMRRRSVAVA